MKNLLSVLDIYIFSNYFNFSLELLHNTAVVYHDGFIPYSVAFLDQDRLKSTELFSVLVP